MRNRAIRRLRHDAGAAARVLPVCAWLVLGFAARAASADDPRDLLKEHGLTHLGDAWVCPVEVEARRWFDSLDALERNYQTLQRVVDERVRANEKAVADLAQKRRDRNALLERIAATDKAALGPTREQLKQQAKDLDEQVRRLKKVALDGTRLAEFQAVREDVIRLANARAALTLAATALRRRSAEMPKEYDRLGKIASVRAALNKLPQHRLGTGKDYAADAAERLARIDKVTNSHIVPVYRDDEHARVLAIVNGVNPVTFSIRHSDGPTHLPHSVVTSLNIATENAPSETYSVGPRKLACRRIKLASVQIGGLVLENVEALALPPEGEDLGAKLGSRAYASQYFDVDYARLRLTILDGSQRPPEGSPRDEGDGKTPGASSRRTDPRPPASTRKSSR